MRWQRKYGVGVAWWWRIAKKIFGDDGGIVVGRWVGKIVVVEEVNKGRIEKRSLENELLMFNDKDEQE